ncbi:TonB-dependent receptor [Faecalibacter bovis]|uniref:TonB-dependent receptor n=1 Tax=Faecalibacter bovis TaxID=2898187 RepID=A0ABX7XC72_9FLAO|nr:TonB-dependent receptor [Faecalibacter bovis]QTV05453.1 TonB-dependent receptor [Faecalibacter bovis]
MKKGLITLGLLLGTLTSLQAQKIITGKIVDENNKPLSNVLVQEPISKKWTHTKEDGTYKIEVSSDNTTLIISQLGKDLQEVIVDPDFNNVTTTLFKQNLRLEEVVIFPKRKKEYSEIVLGKEAVENVQAFSINEVLEQLPGQFTPDFNNNQFKNIVFRTANNNANITKLTNASGDRQDYFANRAFGTSIVVNDIPLSNNENMQTFSPNTSGAFSYNSGNTFGDGSDYSFSNANYGVDLREVATNNIEEIKVVQGIASAKYGDMTSGLVLIQTKVGETPYRASISMRDATTEYNLSKGFRLSSRNFVNAQINFLESNSDPRNSLTKYNRLNGNISWKTNNLASTLTNTLTANIGYRADELKNNPDDFADAKVKDDRTTIRISNNLKWNLNKSWIETINVDANLNYEKSNSYKEEWRNLGNAAITDSTSEGIHQAIIVPAQYFYNMNVEGIPISTYLNIEGVKSLQSKNEWIHTFSAGLSTRTSSNQGRGRYTTGNGVPNYLTLSGAGGSLGYRDYNFRNTKTVFQFSAYAEDQITKYFDGDAVLKLDLGLRYENQLGFSTLQPRINTSYGFNKFLRLRGGFGMASKTPSLNQLYTGNRFYDYLLGDGIYSVPGAGLVGWIQTFELPADNPDLKPIRSMNTEFGVDLNFKFGTLNVTGFYNKMTDGITSIDDPFQRTISEIALDTSSSTPSYNVIGERNIGFFGSQLRNALESEDLGLEAFMTFKRIKPLNLDIQVNSSYIKTTNTPNKLQYSQSTVLTEPEKYAVYNGLESKTDQLTLGSNFNYHLRKVGLLVSLRTEHILRMNHNRNQNRFPIGYLDDQMQYHAIPVEDQMNTDLYGHLIKTSVKGEESLQNSIHNIHFRLSKDFMNGFKISVYTTNVFGLKPTYFDTNGVKQIYPIAQFSLGGKLEYSF